MENIKVENIIKTSYEEYINNDLLIGVLVTNLI